MSFLSKAAGAIGSALGGPVGGALVSGAFNLYGQSRQQDFTQQAYKHRHQWEVEDLRKAGLNPILSSQYSGGPALQSGLPSSPDFASAFQQQKLIKLQQQQLAFAAQKDGAMADYYDKLRDGIAAENDFKNVWFRTPEGIKLLKLKSVIDASAGLSTSSAIGAALTGAGTDLPKNIYNSVKESANSAYDGFRLSDVQRYYRDIKKKTMEDLKIKRKRYRSREK